MNINTEKTDQIRAEANKGYTRILELTEKQVESGKDLITVQDYNYDKFFDALRVANTDKWDDKNQTYKMCIRDRLITAPIEIISFRCAFWRQKADVRFVLGVTNIIK